MRNDIDAWRLHRRSRCGTSGSFHEYGLKGFFQCYEGNDDLMCAEFLTNPKAKTPVFCSFSTVGGSAGSPDCARDVRGFAVKFYTSQGIELSDDPLLQGRLLSYLDTQLSRLGGTNFTQIPVHDVTNGVFNRFIDDSKKHRIWNRENDSLKY